MNKLLLFRFVLSATLVVILAGNLEAQQVHDLARLNQQQDAEVDEIFIRLQSILSSHATVVERFGFQQISDQIELINQRFDSDDFKQIVKQLLEFKMKLSGSYAVNLGATVSVPGTITPRLTGGVDITYVNRRFEFGTGAAAMLEVDIANIGPLIDSLLGQVNNTLAFVESLCKELEQGASSLQENHDLLFKINLVAEPATKALKEALNQDIAGENLAALGAVCELVISVSKNIEKNMAFELQKQGQKAALRNAIERNLAGSGTSPYPLATYVLPEEKGGHLDLVGAIVEDTIDKMETAGTNIYDAKDLLSGALLLRSMGRFKEAYYYYSFAYNRATGLVINAEN